MKTILVTGGCGFIFSNFIWYMLSKYPDYRIINLDAITYAGRIENTENFKSNKNYLFIKGDICNEPLVDRLMQEVDWVVHGAAETHVDRSIEKSFDFIQTNIVGTRVLLEAAKRHKISRFIFTSTDEVYGAIEQGSFNEESPFRANSPYAASKAGADMLARAYFITYDLPVIIIRPSNNFGFNQHCEKLIPRFIINAFQNKKVGLFGNGLQQREWLFVLDCVEAIDLILHKGEIGQAYNIGGGRKNEKTNLWITKLILKILNKSEKLIKFIEDRPGHDIRYSLDSSKIQELDWKPKWPLETALKETIQWYINRPDYWRSLMDDKFVK